MRLDHLLSKEHLQTDPPVYAGGKVCQEYMPVAQTQVLRRVLKGGISTNSGCLVLASSSTDVCFFFGKSSCPGTVGFGLGGLVFGTLLGPEATGPGLFAAYGLRRVWYLFVSGFLAAPITRVDLLGLCVGCVVWGCCLRTT